MQIVKELTLNIRRNQSQIARKNLKFGFGNGKTFMILHCDHWMDMNHYKICKRCPPVSLDLYINNHQIPQNHKSLNHKLCRLFYCLFCCRCRWSCCCRWPRHCRCRCQCWRRRTVLGNDHQRNMTVEWAQYWTLEVEGPLNFLCLIYTAHTLTAESEKPRQRVSNADRKVFAKSSLLAEEFPDILENVRILYKISRWYAKCPDELESFHMM